MRSNLKAEYRKIASKFDSLTFSINADVVATFFLLKLYIELCFQIECYQLTYIPFLNSDSISLCEVEERTVCDFSVSFSY